MLSVEDRSHIVGQPYPQSGEATEAVVIPIKVTLLYLFSIEHGFLSGTLKHAERPQELV